MKKSLLVAIFVPTTDKSGKDFGGELGELATGFPVGKDLILTARHVLDPDRPYSRDVRHRVKICWYYSNTTDLDWIEIPEGDIVWKSQGDLDAALIRCSQRPRDAVGWGIVSSEKPHDDMRWISEGFPRATKYDDVCKPSSFGGLIRSKADQESYFELTEDAQPRKDEDWKGVSGMPVFVSDKILGVVQSVPRKFNAKKLYATPIWKLLQDEGFRKELGIDEQRERLESARKMLHRLLEGSEKATRDLASALNLGSSSGDILKCRGQVIEALLNETPPLERLFELGLSIQEKRRTEKDRAGARVAANLILTILPAIHEAAAVSEVRRCKGDASVRILALPTKLKTLAEIIMAGADRRVARLRSPATRLVFPEGEACLPEPPESGRDADGKQFVRDWRAHLLETFDTDLDRFKGAFQDYLKERFIPSDLRSPGAGIAEKELLDTVAAQLRQEAGVQDGGLTYYFIAWMPENPEAQRKREDILAELKQAFPPIAFLRLAGAEPLNVEWERYGKLRDLLYEDSEANR
ncbi:MAG: hypothetical protein V9H25_18875 [Candidatus Competibacter sp.]